MSKGGQKASTATNQVVLPSWITDQAQANLSDANAVADQTLGQTEGYGGEKIAALTPDQLASYSYLRDTLGTGAGKVGAATDAVTGENLTSTAEGLLNPYLDNVERYALDAVNRSGALAQNDLASKAEGIGAFGGSRYGVQSGVLSGETARAAGSTSANIRAQGWDTAVSRALDQSKTVANQAALEQQLGQQSAAALGAAGQQQQNQQQAEDTAAWQEWQRHRDLPLQALAIRQSALRATPYGSTTTSSQPYNSGSPVSSALGGALSGAAAGSVIPGWGTAVGAGIGLLGGLLK